MRARQRRQLLALHVLSSGMWLGALTAATRTDHPDTLLVILAPAAGTSLVTGIALTSRMGHLRWVQAKTAIGFAAAGAGGAIAATHATGPTVVTLRAAGALALAFATVIAVTKPGTRTQRDGHHRRRETVMGSYLLRIVDRGVRTALQVFLGYLVAAHTVGGVDWRTATLAAVLAIAVALLQGLVDLPQVPVLGVWGDVLGRAVRTAAQVALGSVGANAILITDIPWTTVASAAGLAALTSIVTSLIAMPIGPDSVKGTPELVPAGPTARPAVVPSV